jgi:hypothetical protein
MPKTEHTLDSLLTYFQSINLSSGYEIDSGNGFLTAEQAQSLQNEIESKYICVGNFVFGQRNNDIRQRLFNFDNPYIYFKFKDFELRVIDGLIEGEPCSGSRLKTYLLYADNQILGKFYKIADVKLVVRNIDLYYNKSNIFSDSIGI